MHKITYPLKFVNQILYRDLGTGNMHAVVSCDPTALSNSGTSPCCHPDHNNEYHGAEYKFFQHCLIYFPGFSPTLLLSIP